MDKVIESPAKNVTTVRCQSDKPDRIYRLFFGLALLLALYFNLNELMSGLIVMTLLEGITGLRVPLLLLRLVGNTRWPLTEGMFSFESERIWRLVVGLLLLVSVQLSQGMLWFFPWFMGFTILGAGVSRVCPMLIVAKAIGFK